MPPKKSRRGVCHSLILWRAPTRRIATMVETRVAKRMGKKTSAGLLAPACILNAIILVGIRVSPLALMARNMIMASEALSGSLLSSCRRFMVSSPRGVAALSNPNRLAEILIKILPIAGSPWGIEGNNVRSRGLIPLAIRGISPLFSPTLMSPIQKQSTPVRARAISNAVCADWKVACSMVLNIVRSPWKTQRTTPASKADAKKATKRKSRGPIALFCFSRIPSPFLGVAYRSISLCKDGI